MLQKYDLYRVGEFKVAYKSKDIKNHWKNLLSAANKLLNELGPKFTETQAGHIQTDIAAMGSLAGLMILQESVQDLRSVITVGKPGDAILSDVYEGQRDVYRFLTGMYVGNGILTKSDAAIQDCDKPLFTCEMMTKKLCSPFYEICFSEQIERTQFKFIAALVGFKLVIAGQKMNELNVRIGKGLLDFYIIAGSKTIPYVDSLWLDSSPKAE